MSAVMRAKDWTSTPLGLPETWPEGLKVPLRMMLTSRFEMWLGWGPDVAFFYNDAYIPTLGIKHPAALGQPMREVWKEVFATVEDRIRSVMQDGVATWDEALLLLLERRGYAEETYHTFSYSPLRGDGPKVEGLMCVVTEVTERIIIERRLETLRTLATALIGVRTRADVTGAVKAALQTNERDFPFSVVRFLDSAHVPDHAPAHGAALEQHGLALRQDRGRRGGAGDPPRDRRSAHGGLEHPGAGGAAGSHRQAGAEDRDRRPRAGLQPLSS